MTKKEFTACKQEEVEASVRTFLEILQREHDLTPEDLRAMIDNLRWLSTHRRLMEKMGNWLIGSVASAFAVWLAVELYEGWHRFHQMLVRIVS